MELSTNLVWIDLEMTGLIPEKDKILEIATVITDSTLCIIEEGPTFVINQNQQAISNLDPWVHDVHSKSGLLNEVQESTITESYAQKATLDFIKQHCEPNTGLLSGNSVWQDRAFLRIYMPEIITFLHYRLLDVTSFKEAIIRWYPDDPHITFEKHDVHRAMPDIRESIAELRHYRKYFFV